MAEPRVPWRDRLVQAMDQTVLDPWRDSLIQSGEGRSFEERLLLIEWCTRRMDALATAREELLVRTDEAFPHADRRKMSDAVGWKPSVLYQRLGRRGRPTNRRAGNG